MLMLNLTICLAHFELTLPWLTTYCRLFSSNGTTTAATPSAMNAEYVIKTYCCPWALNTTHEHPKKLTRLEETRHMCSFPGLSHNRCKDNQDRDQSFIDAVNYGFFTCVIPIGCIANLLMILTISRVSHNHNFVPMLFIKNLAIADIISLLGYVIMYSVYNNWTTMPTKMYKYLFSSFDILTGSASLLHIMAISIDRAIAVVFPFKHFSGTINSKARVSTILLWCFSILLFILSMTRIGYDDEEFSTHFHYSVIIIAFMVPCAFVFLSYTVIIAVTIRSNQQLVRDNVRRNSAISTTGLNRFREIKLAINVTVIILPIMFGWGFVAIVSIVEGIRDTLSVYGKLIFIVPITMSSINPLVYLMMTASLRKNSLKTLHSFVFCKTACCISFATNNATRLRFGSYSRNSTTRDSGMMIDDVVEQLTNLRERNERVEENSEN
ncbi:somatostatin receptor type 2-like [Clytia hemisphaerica]|uniref:somatostatin receptor type 2-like n=1 Tax=Clytia hemisphaerica TaxID=252671 RepID=UPI0034D4A33B